MKEKRILVTKPIPQAGLDLLRRHGEVSIGPEGHTLTSDELRQRVRGAHAILCFVADPIDEGVLEAAAPTCRVVASYGVGTDNINIAAATRLGIRVTNTPGVLTDATADLAWTLILAASRQLGKALRYAHSGEWPGIEPMQIFGHSVTGKTLGIVGAGRIGTAVARRAAGFRMPVVYTGRGNNTELDAAGARRLPLETLLGCADVVSLHVSLSSTTRHMIGSAELRLMKPTAYLVNTSRGAVVNEGDLIVALRTGVIAGAGLDVFENEPNIPRELLAMPNVVCLPHIGSATNETRAEMARVAATNVIACLEGAEPPNPVN
jgi:glyoxylate reductase